MPRYDGPAGGQGVNRQTCGYGAGMGFYRAARAASTTNCE